MTIEKVNTPIRLRSTRILIVYFDLINQKALKSTLMRIFQINNDQGWNCYIKEQNYKDGTTHTIVYILLQTPCDVYSSSLYFKEKGAFIPFECWTLTKNSEKLGFAFLSLKQNLLDAFSQVCRQKSLKTLNIR